MGNIIPEVSPIKSSRLPAYVMNWAVVDLLFSLIHIPLILILCSIMTSPSQCSIADYIIPLELVSSGFILIFDPWANIRLLRGKPKAVKLAYVSISATFISILLMIWDLCHQIVEAESWLAIISTVLSDGSLIVARVILLFLYGLAIRKAKAFFAETSSCC